MTAEETAMSAEWTRVRSGACACVFALCAATAVFARDQEVADRSTRFAASELGSADPAAVVDYDLDGDIISGKGYTNLVQFPETLTRAELAEFLAVSGPLERDRFSRDSAFVPTHCRRVECCRRRAQRLGGNSFLAGALPVSREVSSARQARGRCFALEHRRFD